jgi:hypothetical protein
MENAQKNKVLETIAKKFLRIDTLQAQNSDLMDFHDLAVWSIESALRAAYESGQQSSGK